MRWYSSGCRGRVSCFLLCCCHCFCRSSSRILPTILVTDALGLLNTYSGLILPVTATGLGTLILRGQLKQMPPEVIEAARIDGAGPWRVFKDIIVPLSVPILAALLAFFFVLGWNQYLWPLVSTPSAPERATLVSGIAMLQNRFASFVGAGRSRHGSATGRVRIGGAVDREGAGTPSRLKDVRRGARLPWLGSLAGPAPATKGQSQVRTG